MDLDYGDEEGGDDDDDAGDDDGWYGNGVEAMFVWRRSLRSPAVEWHECIECL